MSSNRKLTYSLAINEALTQLMESDDSVILLGQGVRALVMLAIHVKDW